MHMSLLIVIFLTRSVFSYLNCSKEPVAIPRRKLTEELLWYDNERVDSFHEYIHNIYGEYPDIRYKYDIDVLYIRSDVSFRFDNTYLKRISSSFLDVHLKKHMIGIRDQAPVVQHRDYEWVEVTRSATPCIYHWFKDPIGVETEGKKLIEYEYYEGFSRGWPDPDIFNRNPKPYGCYFHMLRGTGIYINVGKTLVAMNRTNLYQLLNLSCVDASCLMTPDHVLCPAIIALGLDSIQIYNSQKERFAELIFCTGNCSTDAVRTACPPVELRTGINATKLCFCNASFPILNCNNKLTDVTDCFHIGREEPRTKQTCYFEDFSWKNEFKSQSVSIAIFFTWHRHGDLDRLKKVKNTLDRYIGGGWSTILADSGHFSYFNDTLFDVLQAMDSLKYDIVSIRESVDIKVRGMMGMFHFQALSLILPGFLRSTIISRRGVDIGFISYSMQDVESVNVDLMVQLIIDESLCLKRKADIIILLSADNIYFDAYVAQKTSKFVDIVLGGNSQISDSCSNLWHANDETTVIHSKHTGSYLTVVSIEILSRSSYAFKSDILAL